MKCFYGRIIAANINSTFEDDLNDEELSDGSHCIIYFTKLFKKSVMLRKVYNRNVGKLLNINCYKYDEGIKRYEKGSKIIYYRCCSEDYCNDKEFNFNPEKDDIDHYENYGV